MYIFIYLYIYAYKYMCLFRIFCIFVYFIYVVYFIYIYLFCIFDIYIYIWVIWCLWICLHFVRDILATTTDWTRYYGHMALVTLWGFGSPRRHHRNMAGCTLQISESWFWTMDSKSRLNRLLDSRIRILDSGLRLCFFKSRLKNQPSKIIKRSHKILNLKPKGYQNGANIDAKTHQKAMPKQVANKIMKNHAFLVCKNM